MQNTALSNGIEEVFPEFRDRDRERINNLFSEVDIKNINFYQKSNILEISILSKKLIPAQVLAEAEEIFACYFKINSIHIKAKFDIDRPLDSLIEEYWESILFRVGRRIATSKGLLSGSECHFKNKNKNLIVCLKTRGAYLLKARGCDKCIQEIIEEAFSAKIKVDFEDGEIDEYLYNEYLENKKNEEARILENIMLLTSGTPGGNHGKNAERSTTKSATKSSANSPAKRRAKSTKRKAESENREDVIYGNDFNDALLKICSINQDSGIVVFEGVIMKADSKNIKENRCLYTFDITDYTSSLTVKFFAAKKDADRINAKLAEGATVKVKGETRYDKFAGEFVIIASDIVQVEKQRRMDTAEEKRVELHLHTRMSAMDGVSPVEELIKRASEWGHKAVAITDHGVVQAYPGASIAARKYNIKIIYGVECYLFNNSSQNSGQNANKGNNGGRQKADTYHTIILARNAKGLKNLYKLVSLSHIEQFYKKPRIPKDVLAQYRDGLLIGTACEAGELYRAFLEGRSEEEILEIASFYDYFEIQPLDNNKFMLSEGIVNSMEDLAALNKKIVQLGEKMEKLVVATCDVHFLDQADEVFRRILMAGQGYDDADRQAPLFFRTTGEMIEEFMYLGKEKAYEIVVKNTNIISDTIENISPIPSGTFPPKLEGAEEKIVELAMGQAREKYGACLPKTVEDRMKRELDSIVKNGFSVMYLIASTLVQKSVNSGYLVGSRGSVGSSIVAYFSGITEVNPLKPHYICDKCKYSEFITDGSYDCGYDLPGKICPACGEKLRKDGYDIPFETFLGFEGDKEPDIDLNFSGEYQARAHKFVEELFGEDHVYRAGTISSIAEKTAYGFVKGYLDEKGMVVTNAEMNRLIRGCMGVKRTTGQHPGGVIIIPQDMEIYDFTPIQYPADDEESHTITTHFDYDFLHGSIFKLDILGHDDPTTLKMLEDLTGIDPRSIPIGEPLTMSIFSSTDALGITPSDINCEVGTLGIPEFGTKFVRQMLVETRPKTVSELVRISGLSHGTNLWVNNAQDLIKSGIATLSKVICARDDIMLNLIQSGLPPITAFKIMEDVRKGKGLTKEYEDIMRQHNVPEWYIESCKIIEYMFPKSHSAAYVMMAFRISWFKVYYPLEFYSVYFTVKADNFDAKIMTRDKPAIRNFILEIENRGNNVTQKEKDVLTLLEVVNEMYARNIRFLPVDLYKSDVKKFTIENGSIRPPLIGLQGLGVTAAQNIANARREGKFSSVEELKVRGKASKTVIDVLKEHGCLGDLPESNQISLF